MLNHLRSFLPEKEFWNEEISQVEAELLLIVMYIDLKSIFLSIEICRAELDKKDTQFPTWRKEVGLLPGDNEERKWNKILTHFESWKSLMVPDIRLRTEFKDKNWKVGKGRWNFLIVVTG